MNATKQMKWDFCKSLFTESTRKKTTNLFNFSRPLHIAARDGDEIMLKRNCMALKHRFKDINWLTVSGENALHVAVSHNRSLGCIQILLNYGANVLEETEDGDNVLHLAAKYCKNIQIFRVLLRTVPLDKLTKFNFDGKCIFFSFNKKKIRGIPQVSKVLLLNRHALNNLLFNDCVSLRLMVYNV